MKVAVIGCGMIARTQHIQHYHDNDKAAIKMLVDPLEERARSLAAEFNVPHTSADYRAILEDDEIEAVSICTPNDTHAPIAIDCLNAGKHVLCEKPAALNMEQVREMQAAANRNGRILNIGVVNRYAAGVNRIKDMIEGGELGRVYHVYCSFRSHRSIPGLGGPFTTKSKSGGGVLIDWGVHFLDLIFYSLGQPGARTVSGEIYGELAKDMKAYAYVNMWAGPPNYNGTYDVEDFVTGLVRTTGPTISLNGAWAQNIGGIRDVRGVSGRQGRRQARLRQRRLQSIRRQGRHAAGDEPVVRQDGQVRLGDRRFPALRSFGHQGPCEYRSGHDHVRSHGRPLSFRRARERSNAVIQSLLSHGCESMAFFLTNWKPSNSVLVAAQF
ncbi:Gfo/Idh/MocA family protein [Cohnella rhizosphaerae]|uniref:Gfo/Idh/MocA family protein n=1 Tax=Cohnella rhizosphaerae TaxID=1457232 RepID=UPI0030B90980